jgi:predicted outer membrane repeat protein
MMGWMCVWGCLGWADAAVYYVDDSATGANSGSSWVDAFTDLQVALDTAIKGDEIRVATGVYRPAGPGGHREISFVIPDGVAVMGGFAGSGFENPDQRDLDQFPSTLSGDLNNDDAAVDMPENLSNEPSRQDNSFHVVKATYVYPATYSLLDGFTITGGNANGDHYTKTSGAGIEGSSYALEVQNCIIEFNSATDRGGGCDSVRTLSNCIIRNNCAGQGGGLIGPASLDSCRIEGNVARTGGGIFEPAYEEDEAFVNCIIRGNRAVFGGGLYLTNHPASCEGCLFEGNTAAEDGGAVYIMNNCTCRSELLLNRCKLVGNKAETRGGALYQEGNPQVRFLSTLVSGNTAEADGGGLFCNLYQGMVGSGWCSVTNSTIVHNAAAGIGGGLTCVASVPEYFSMVNSVLWGNRDRTGSGTWDAQFRLSVTGNGTGTHVPPSGPEYEPVNYSCIQGWKEINGGQGNIGDDPLFADADGADTEPGTGDDDYHLTVDSPCIDAGRNSPSGDSTETPVPSTGTGGGSDLRDLDGNPRIRGGIVDMGAYEFQYVVGTVLYVDDSAVGVNNGANWGDAFPKLQDALTIAAPGQEIRVAQGTYRPADPNGLRESSFILKDGVVVRGGFAGYGSDNPDDHDIERYDTILSGDLLSNDTPLKDVQNPYDDPMRRDNSYHVLAAQWLTGRVILEGLIVTSGYSIDAGSYGTGGAGLRAGAGDQVQPGVIMIAQCRFIGNVAYDGGAVEASVTQLNIARSMFTGNFAQRLGGAISLWFNSAEVENSIFTDNVADDGGGIHGFNHRLSLRQCVFVDNIGGFGGGAIHSSHFCQLDLSGCILWQNHADLGPQIWAGEGVKGTISYCDIDHLNDDGITCEWQECLSLGPGNMDVDPLFANAADGDYHLDSQTGRWDADRSAWVRDNMTSPCIDAGDAMNAIMHEPFPNGGIVNMGAYGGTAEASKSWFGGEVCGVIITGDLNGDCVVNLADVALIAVHWLEDRR